MIVALVSQKGGVGKSTAAIAVACEWASRGERVLLVDADPQATLLTWAAVASEASRQPPAVVAMGAGMHAPSQLPRVGAAFDRIVIDSPGRSDATVRSALMVAGLAVLPVGPSPADAWALASTVQLVRDAQTLRPELRAVALLTRLSPRTALSRSTRGVVQAAGVDVLRSILSARVAYAEALAAGQGPGEYDGRCRVEVQRLTDELEQLADVAQAQQETAHVA
jgi:chromosome partitioning protein